MNNLSTNDCGLEFIGEWYDASWAVEICGNAEGRLFDKDTEKSRENEVENIGWDE